MLWSDSRGEEGPLVLLLHGLGATGAVWGGVVHALAQRCKVRTLVVDLPGHGRSQWSPPYSVGGMVAQIAPLVPGQGEVHVIGHSLGVYLGLALASGWYNRQIASVTGVGPKLSWSEEDFARMRELANRPVRYFGSRAEALDRYRRVSGLDSSVAPEESFLAGGIVSEPEGHRLAADPRTFAVGAPAFAGLVAMARCPLRLARGERDGMVSISELRQFDAGAVEFSAIGHNAHVEAPAVVVGLVEPMLAHARDA